MTSSLRLALAAFAALVALAGCGADSRDARDETGSATVPQAGESPDVPAPTRPRIVVLGDSLTAGLGLDATDAFPAVLERRLRAAGYEYDVVNAGVSGDTSAGGLRRLDWALGGDVRVLVLALGANDGLRGLSPAELKRNLAAIIRRARERRITVLLCGMEAPPNLGPQYTSAFRQAYRELAREEQVAFVPFLLQGVAGEARYNQSDGIHPNEEGARRVAENVWAALEPMLGKPGTDD